MGTVFSAFVLGYTLFQVPGRDPGRPFWPKESTGLRNGHMGYIHFLSGMIGEISLLTGLSVLNALIALRFLFGIFQAPMFPTSTRTVTNWFPLSERARANGLAISGVVSFFFSATSRFLDDSSWSWQSSFYIAAVSSLLLAVAWALYVRDYPSQHRAVNAAELNAIQAGAVLHSELTSRPPSIKCQLASGNLWRLVASYALDGYVAYVFIFWIFLYLKQVRHLSQAESVWLTTVPWILATLTTLGGGYLSDRLIKTGLGIDWGRRIVPMGCQVGAAIFLTIGHALKTHTWQLPFWPYVPV